MLTVLSLLDLSKGPAVRVLCFGHLRILKSSSGVFPAWNYSASAYQNWS